MCRKYLKHCRHYHKVVIGLYGFIGLTIYRNRECVRERGTEIVRKLKNKTGRMDEFEMQKSLQLDLNTQKL